MGYQVNPTAPAALSRPVRTAGMKRETAMRSPQVTATLDSRRKQLGMWTLLGALTLGSPSSVSAGGGSTAGKYSSQPIAKRRYYGKVSNSIYRYLSMGDSIVTGDFKTPAVEAFFGQTITSKKKNNKRTEKKSSQWITMQKSMYLLGNAFRFDSSMPPDRVQQVQDAKAFFAEMEALQIAMNKGKTEEANKRYAQATEKLNKYLNGVELPPTYYRKKGESQTFYSRPFEEAAELLCEGSFCI